MNAGLPTGIKSHQEDCSLFKEGINTSHPPETQTDVCSAGMLHRAKWHNSNSSSDSHIDTLQDTLS